MRTQAGERARTHAHARAQEKAEALAANKRAQAEAKAAAEAEAEAAKLKRAEALERIGAGGSPVAGGPAMADGVRWWGFMERGAGPPISRSDTPTQALTHPSRNRTRNLLL